MIAPSLPRLTDDQIDGIVEQLRSAGVTSLIGTYIDNGGVARAKQVPLERIRVFHLNGLGASYSWAVFAIDDTLQMTPEFSAVGDMRMRADLTSLRILDGHVAWAPLELFDQSGMPLDHCPRGRLRQCEARMAHAGLSALAAFEIEFAWFDAASGQVGDGSAYGLRAMMENEDFFRDIMSSFECAGLGIEQIHAEAGLGQIEVSVRPAGPLAAADALVLARLILCRVARRHSKRLSFAPQSLEEGIGSGAHLHLSMMKEGAPILSGGDGASGLTAQGEHAIGGILKWLPESLGVLAPSLLSAYRLQPGKWSGAWRGWGIENRESAVRLCLATLGNPYGAHLELKVTDHTANPYAVVAVVLGLAQKGISDKTPLPDALPVDVGSWTSAQLRRRSIRVLDGDQGRNLELTIASETIEEILGRPMLAAIKAVRGHEVELARSASRADLVTSFRFAWSS